MAPVYRDTAARLCTFSIVAFDPASKALGVAVESKFVAAGAVVPWVKAGVGAIASQAYANTAYGPAGLRLLKAGRSPKEVIAAVTARDPPREQRQLGVVDARGRSAAFTGRECLEWAGHRTGRNFSAQGNILVSQGTVDAMVEAYLGTEGDLPIKMLTALSAGQRAGGDRRGQESAAIIIEKPAGGYGGFNDRWVDIRVDDHPRPIDELSRIFEIYDLCLLDRDARSDVVELSGAELRKVQEVLAKDGMLAKERVGGPLLQTLTALEKWFSINNFENKWRKDGKMAGSVYRYMMKVSGP